MARQRRSSPTTAFDVACVRCGRLASFLAEVRQQHPSYYARPVPSFGDWQARLLIVGLAPGMHGANRTGRPFTGDHAGLLLYRTLHAFGFSSQPAAIAPDDGLELIDCRIANAVKCLPPKNKPVAAEIRNCNAYLAADIQQLRPGSVMVALGGLAHGAILKAVQLKPKAFAFGHANVHELPGGLRLVDSYHCSRYNTQTGRLTSAMFERVFEIVKSLL